MCSSLLPAFHDGWKSRTASEAEAQRVRGFQGLNSRKARKHHGLTILDVARDALEADVEVVEEGGLGLVILRSECQGGSSEWPNSQARQAAKACTVSSVSALPSPVSVTSK